MPPFDEIRAEKLIELAHARWALELSDAELKVLHESASSLDPEVPSPDGQRPLIRGEFVRWLATDADAAPHIDPKGLRIGGVALMGGLDLRDSHVAVPLLFYRCAINGDFDLQFAQTKKLFLQKSWVNGAFRAGGVTVGGPLILTESTFRNGVWLQGARIKGELNCDKAIISVQEGDALSVEGAQIDGHFFLRNGFQSSGTIRLLCAHIKGQFNCNDAKLMVREQYSINGDWVSIGASAMLGGEFETIGTVRLLGAQIVGELNFLGASLFGVQCPNISVSGDFVWRGIHKCEWTFLDLAGGRVGNLRDDRESWPDQNKLGVDGLVYDELSLHPRPTVEQIKQNSFDPAPPLSAADRIEWLLLQPPSERFQPQPWIQLSARLDAQGDHAGANHVLYELKCLQASRSGPVARRLLGAFAWLEEAPIRIAWSIAFFLLLGWLIFGHAAANGVLAPTDSGAYLAFTTGKPMPEAYPVLNPFMYTLENSLPLVKLGQDEKWAPDRSHIPTAAFTGYWFLMWARWSLILLGWFQATILAAALSGIFKQ